MTTLLIADRRFIHSGGWRIPEGFAGYWSQNEGGLLFITPDRVPFAQLVNNAQSERFFVTVGLHAGTRLYYMNGLAEMDRQRLGLPASNRERTAIADKAIEDSSPVPALSLITHQRDQADPNIWRIVSTTQSLSLGLRAGDSDAAANDAIARRVAEAGLSLPPGTALDLASIGAVAAHTAPSTHPLCVLHEDAHLRTVLYFEPSSEPARRFHGDPAVWQSSHLDLSARISDWRAESAPPLPSALPATAGLRF